MSIPVVDKGGGGSGATDTDAIHDNVSGEINAITSKATPVDADILIIEDSAVSWAKKKITLADLPGGSGESNTASSQGTGTSIYYQKSGVDLQFNAIKSENDRLSIALDGITHDVELTVNEGNIVHQNISGAGTNSHTQIDTHIGLTDEHLNWKNSVGTIHTDNYIEGGAGTDTSAIHDNIANEITAITAKITLANLDEFVLEDSGAAFVKKAVTFGNIEGSISLANLGTRTHASLSDAPTDAHHAQTHDNTYHSTNYHTETDGTGVVTVHSDVSSAGSGSIITTAERNGLHSQSHGSADHSAESDAQAIHDNVANEITGITNKVSMVGADELLIEDSEATYNKKAVLFSVLEGAINHSNITGSGGNIHIDWESGSAGTIHTDNYIEGGAGTDTTAIHDNEASEISAITEKVSPVGADMLLIEDSQATNAKKMVQITNLPGGADADAIHDNVDNEIQVITAKGSPVGADVILIEDSAASWAKKSVLISNLPAGSPSFGVPTGNIDIGDTATEGSSGDSTRADHQHQFSAPGASYPVQIDIGDSQIDGTATTPARSDHGHAFPAPAGGYPLDVGDAESDGTATTPARSDHVHAHGSRTNSNAHRWNDIAANPDTVTFTIGKATPTAVVLGVGHNGTSAYCNTFHIADHVHSSTAGAGGVINHSDLNDDESTQHVDWASASAGTIHTDNYIEGGDGTDTTALHDDTANEITAITPKTAIVSADEFILEDSEAVFVKKAVTFGNIESSLSLANIGGELTLTDLGSYSAQGDIIRGGASDWEVLTLGTDNYHLVVNGTTFGWEVLDITHDTNLTASVAEINAVADATGRAQGDLLYASVADTLAWLAKGTDNYFFVMNGNVPNWEALDISLDTSPQLGASLDLNEKGILIDPSLGTNLNYEGTVLELTVSGLTVGNCVYVSGNNTGALADANAVGTMPAIGVYVGTNLVLTHGIIRQDTWGWTAGQRLYVAGDGTLTSTAPSATGDYVQIMGIAVNADAVLIMPSLTEVKHL